MFVRTVRVADVRIGAVHRSSSKNIVVGAFLSGDAALGQEDALLL
jgi:hypothetical protein